MKQFLSLYHRLDRETLACLESVCLHEGQVLTLSERHLNRLLDLELLDFGQEDRWKPTWLGRGVDNWHKQLHEAVARKLKAPKPRPGENGAHPGPPCNEFRELLFSGIYCWCGRLRSEHPAEAVRTASNLLSHLDRNRRLGSPQHRVTGRSFASLAAGLPSQLRHFLQLISTRGVTLHDLHQLLSGRVRFLALQASLSYLAENDLVYMDETELLWFPSWEGVGVKNWLQEQFVRQALKEPMPAIRFGENGTAALSAVCDSFRPLLSLGGLTCWCGHLSQDHRR